MPTIRFFRYEFSDYDEAKAAIDNWNLAKPRQENMPPYPYFEIDKIDMEGDDMTIWLKLKKED